MGAIVIVVIIIGFIALGAFASRFASDLGFNSDGTMQACDLISTDDVRAILGEDAEAMPMGGLVSSTIGQVLDKRILPDAPECWLISGTSTSVTGRLAEQDGDASGTFANARSSAEAGGYYAGPVGFGDEAFCTAMTEVGSFGILVRRGDRLAYVSLLDADAMEAQDFQVGPDGQLISPQVCDLAGRIAEAALR